MFYIYILYSRRSDRYYIGYSDDPEKRLDSHNTSERKTYTSKHRPWELAASFPVSELRGEVMKVEKYLKRQKSRKLIEEIINHQDDVEWIHHSLLSSSKNYSASLEKGKKNKIH